MHKYPFQKFGLVLIQKKKEVWLSFDMIYMVLQRCGLCSCMHVIIISVEVRRES